MINRRNFLIASLATTVATNTLNAMAMAQTPEPDLDLQVTNASFIRKLSGNSGTEVDPITVLDLQNIRGYVLGDPAAPNTLQIFADYRCPHCRIFHSETEPLLIRDFVADGRMNLEILDFTVIGVSSFLTLNDPTIESVRAAEAAACAAEQNAFVPYRNWLYSGDPSTAEGDYADDKLIAAATDLGLDTDLFTTSLTDAIYNEAVASTVFIGMAKGVRGTPSMTFNGSSPFNLPAEGYDVLHDALEQEMAK